MPDWMSDERKNLLRSYGARVRLVSRDEGGFIGSVRRARKQEYSRAFSCPDSLPIRTILRRIF